MGSAASCLSPQHVTLNVSCAAVLKHTNNIPLRKTSFAGVQKLGILRNFLLAQSLLGKGHVKEKDPAWKHRGLMACAVPACSMRPRNTGS